MTFSRRLEQVRRKLEEEKLDALLVSAPENIRYLSGFTGSAGYLLISYNLAVLATDFRYVEQASRQSPDFVVERISGGPEWLPRLATQMEASRIGIESSHLTVASYDIFQRAFDALNKAHNRQLVPITDIVSKIRAVKDASELAFLKRAVDIADNSLDQMILSIEPGITEQQVAWELEKTMRESGADAIAFDIIVGAGPNGALPHHRASNKIIEEGEMVVIDMGAQYEGYCSDLTRTIVLGEPDDTFTSIYSTVLEAQLVAEERVTAGMTGGETDALARDLIDGAGYSDNFGHSLGHGIGLAVHEFPRVSPRSEDILEDGMVFTIEPGIYISGWGGVRIEDMVVLDNGRAKVLSGASKLTLG